MASQLRAQKAAEEKETKRRQQAEKERVARFRATSTPGTPLRNSNGSPEPGPFAPGFNLPGVTSPAHSVHTPTYATGGRGGRGRGGGRGGGRGNRRNSGYVVTPQQQHNEDEYMSDSEVGSISTVLEEEVGWQQTGDQAARDALAAKFGSTTPDASGGVNNP